MQSRKSLLAKIFGVLCALCCVVALAFGVAACDSNTDTTKSVVNVSVVDGQLVIDYSDGSKEEIDLGDLKGEQGEQGPAGDDGDKGEQGPAGVGITSVTWDETKQCLVITYTDGKTQEVKVEGIGCDCPEPCEHENISSWILSDTYGYDAATQKWTGTILDVCDDCGYAWLITDAEHHHTIKTGDKAATCTEDGIKGGEYCEVCGYVVPNSGEVVPALNHPEANRSTHIVEVEGKDLCTEGGLSVTICDLCDEVIDYTLAPAQGHKVSKWLTEGTLGSGEAQVVAKAPTTTEKGLAIGTCPVCGDYVTKELPAFLNTDGTINSAYTRKDVVPAVDCADQATVNLTISLEVWDAEGVKGTQEVTFTNIVLPAVGHTLDGKKFPPEGVGTIENPIVLDSATYDEATKTYESEYGTIKVDTETEPTCEDDGIVAYFLCDVCDHLVPVQVRVEHIAPANEGVNVTEYDTVEELEAWVATIDKETLAGVEKDHLYIVEPTCTEDGKEYFICDECGELSSIVLEKTGHTVKYKAEIDDKNTPATDDDVLTLTPYCATCGETDETKLNAKKVSLSDFTVTTVEGDPSCQEAGTITYKGTYEGVEYTVTETIPVKNHTFGGREWVPGNSYNYDEVREYVKLEVSTTDEEDISCADGKTLAGVVCEKCDQLVLVYVVVPHTAPTVEENTEVTTETLEEVIALLKETANQLKVYEKAATCTEAGYIAYYCAECKNVVVVAGSSKLVPAEEEQVEGVVYEVDTDYAATGHKAANTLVYNDANGNGVKDADEDWYLVTYCANEVTDTSAAALLKLADADMGKDENNNLKYNEDGINYKGVVEGVVKVEDDPRNQEATCTTVGKQVYKYTKDGVTAEVIVDVPAIYHFYQDEEGHKYSYIANSAVDENGEPYRVGEPGIYQVVGEVPACNEDKEPALAGIICSGCGQLVLIKVIDEHTPVANATADSETYTSYEALKAAVDAENAKAPEEAATLDINKVYVVATACDAPEYEARYCTVCHDWYVELTKEAGKHTLAVDYTTLAKQADGSYTVTVKCTACDFKQEKVAVAKPTSAMLDKEASVAATCQLEGINVYNVPVKVAGQDIVVVVNETAAKVDHALGTIEYTWDTEETIEGVDYVITYKGKLCSTCNKLIAEEVVRVEVKDPDEGEEGGDTPVVPAEPVEYTYDFSTLTGSETATDLNTVLGSTNVTFEGTLGTSDTDLRLAKGHLKFSADAGKVIVTLDNVKAGQTVELTIVGKSGSSGNPAELAIAATNATTTDTVPVVYAAGADYVTTTVTYTATADGSVVLTFNRNTSKTVQLQKLTVVVE